MQLLFDDLVGPGEDRRRHNQAERLGGLQIDHQLECGRLLHRQIGRLGAVEDLPGVSGELAVDSGEAGSIADQAAQSGELTPVIDRRNRMVRRQRDELLALAAVQRVPADEVIE